MSGARTAVEILNKSLSKIAEVKNLYPINDKGDVLRYSKELSDWGRCMFRVSTKDPIHTEFGDIFQPHVYNVRIRRGGVVVWQGVIVNNPSRNRNYIEVEAFEYEYYLSKILIRRDAETTTGDGKNNYRLFTSGTMAANVQTIINNVVTDFGANHPLSALTVGTIDNPDYPEGFVDGNGAAAIGGWAFTNFISLQFDYHSAYYALKAFGIYAGADFEITQDLVFNFKEFIGNKQTGITFEYGTFGNVVDYNATRLGGRMANDVWGIAATDTGIILHVNQRDENSIQTSGLLQDANAFSDVKAQNLLKTRVNESLRFTRTADESPVNLVLNEKSYPLGQYDIGDIVTVKIDDHAISYKQARRIVGITVTLHNTGREMTTVQTNRPKDRDVGV